MRARVDRPHRIPDHPPLVVEVGDAVTVRERSIEWPAFVFVAAEEGSGWVPERFLTADRPEAVVEVRYDTTEIAVEPGDEVEVLERDGESGWWWCRATSGDEGWIPVEVLDTGRP
jgi:hypothetical protein